MAAGAPLVLALLLCLVRIAPLVLGAPLFGRLTRLLFLVGAGGLFAPLFLPTATRLLLTLPSPGPSAPSLLDSALAASLRLAPLFLHELVIGLLLLLLAALPLAALQSAGRLIEPFPAGGHASPLEKLLGLLSLCLFFSWGGAPLLVGVLAKSYEAAPLPDLAATTGSLSLGASFHKVQLGAIPPLFSRLFALSVTLALPILGARLLSELVLSLVARWRWPAARLVRLRLDDRVDGIFPALRALVLLAVLVFGIAALFSEWRAALQADSAFPLPLHR
jgi:type III secretory pathway component EscT